MSEYTFPPDAPEHVRRILTYSAHGIRRFGGQYSLAQLAEALEFALAHPDFARSNEWNKTRQAELERTIRRKERTEEKKRETERRWKMSMES
ncbi:MAG: hypothetical protein ACOYYI_01665 [Chloroflexota bacterium]